MNPDDPNSSQGGAPADIGTQAPEPVAGAPEPMGEGNPAPGAPQTAPATEPMGTPAANCHCGKPSEGGNCTGCNMPEAGCSCPPTV